MGLAEAQYPKVLRIAKQNAASLFNIMQQALLKPVGFRDTSVLYSPNRSNANQTGTTRVQFLPQVNCQDIVFAYSNYYEASAGIVVANTNPITVKASLEINGGATIPIYFNRMRTITIQSGQTVFSEPV